MSASSNPERRRVRFIWRSSRRDHLRYVGLVVVVFSWRLSIGFSHDRRPVDTAESAIR